MTAKGAPGPDVSAILRGKQVRVRLYQAGPRPADAEPPTEDVWFRLDANAIAALEEHFGSERAFNEALDNRPVSALRATIGIGVLGSVSPQPRRPEPDASATVVALYEQAMVQHREELRAVGERMVPDETSRYWAAIEGAYAIALGATEEQAGKGIAARLALSEAGQKAETAARERVIEEMTRVDFGRAPKRSRPGQRPGGTSASSGA